jgi:Cof subfamily protein (haloacid dehalogenase superfamily)
MSALARLRMLLSDVDGTLVTPQKVLTPRAILAAGALRRAGLAFAVTSSRPPAGLAAVARALDLTTPVAGFNGGMVVDRDGTILSKLTLAPEAAAAAIGLLEAWGIDVWVFQGNDWLVTRPDGAYVEHEARTIGYGPVVIDGFAGYEDGVTKIVGSSTDAPRLEAAGEAVRAALGGSVSASLSQSYYLDVTHPEAHKGTALLQMSRILGIPPSEIAAIGDMDNDVRMFEVAGFSVAMGNASPAVQARASAVTARNTEDGFALAVEELILPRAATREDRLG